MVEDLKACPFCGQDDLERDEINGDISCSSCAYTFYDTSANNDWWNSRPIEEALCDQIKRLDIEIEKFQIANIEKTANNLANLTLIEINVRLRVENAKLQDKLTFAINADIEKSRELRTLRDANSWISCVDRLPEKSGWHHVVRHDLDENYCFRDHRFYIGTKGDWQQTGDDLSPVIYWLENLPLPPTPEEK